MSHQRFRARNGFDAEGQRSVKLGDPYEWNEPLGRQDFVPRDWILQRANYTALAGRVGDLPVSTPTAPIRDGTTCLIKYLYNGEQLSRLAIWDSTKTQVGGIGHITADVDAADVANIIANAAANFPGEIYTGGNNDGEFEVTYNANGTLGITITKPGSGYRLGEVYDHNGLANLTKGVHFIVDRLVGPSPTGGWRYVDIESWVKPLVANADVATDQQEGDFQSTVENNHKELKIWHNNAWITLFSEDSIKGWIAALSLFEGTVEPESGTSVGAVKFDALPDLELLSAQKDLSQNSHYWTYVGSPNFVIYDTYTATGLTNGVPGVYRWTDSDGNEFVIDDVNGATASVGVAKFSSTTPPTAGQTINVPTGQVGTGSSAFTFVVTDPTKPATPIIGRDLNGAILNPGDWVQIANRGTAAAPNLHWVTVGGDLLAKARGDKLFGLNQWVAGGWEKGSLVVHSNTIYRAKQGIIAGDPAPDASSGVAQLNEIDIYSPIVDGTKFIITIDGQQVTYTSLPGDDAAAVGQGLMDAVNRTSATARLMLASPSSVIFPPGANINVIHLTGRTVGKSYTVTVSPMAAGAASQSVLSSATTTPPVAPTFNPWEKVDLSGGVRWVMTDGDLPTQAPAGELYFILASPKYGGGTGSLVYFDSGANKWMPLGGAGGRALELSGGLVVYPRNYYMTQTEVDNGDPEPAGRIKGDLLMLGKTGHVKIWDGTAWVFGVYSLPFGNTANANKIAYIDSNGNPALTGKTFDDEFKDRLTKFAPSVGQPPKSAGPGAGASNITALSFMPILQSGSYRQIRYVDKTTTFLLYLRGTGFNAGDEVTYMEHQCFVANNATYARTASNQKIAYDVPSDMVYFPIAKWDNNNLQKANTMGHVSLDYCIMGHNYHFFYQIEFTRIDGAFCVMTGEVLINAPPAARLNYFDINAFTNEGLKYVEHF